MIDVAIVGAGPVGGALAALLAGSGLEVALFEAKPAPSADPRTLALSHGSRELLEEAHAWPAAEATPITSIHVSQQGGFGRTVLEASDQGLPALGYTVSYSVVEAVLDARLAALGIPVHRGESCERIELREDAARLGFASGREAEARLLVLADGGANAAKIPGLASTGKDYGQHAVLAPVRTDRPHGGRAWERFTPRGPMALLPVGERYGLVWTATPAETARLKALDETAFLAELQAAFGDRAGRFVEAGARASFPLRLRTVNSPVALRTAIVGNAAQALHPIAGQGLNLGLRDAAALAMALRALEREAVGGLAMLEDYRASRRRDASRGVAFTDFLVSAFAWRGPLPRAARGAVLAALDLVPTARRALADRMIYGAGSA